MTIHLRQQRRIGAVVAEQVALYGAITREQRVVPGTVPGTGGDVVPMRRRKEREA